jgi:hypothetical protein
VLDSHFAEALAEEPAQAQQKAQQSAAATACQPETSEVPTDEKTQEDQGFVKPGQLRASVVTTGEWAVSGSNG